MAHELLILAPDNRRVRLRLVRDAYALGRAHANDLHYPEDGSLSRRHLRLERDGVGWSVTDLGSKNGTRLNGKLVHGSARLHAGDRLHAGQLTITLIDTEQEMGESVVFVPGGGPELHPSATVMTSLEGLLAAEPGAPAGAERPPSAPPDSTRAFDSPVVRALIRAGRELTHHRPLEELFRLILDLSIETVGGERGVLMTLRGEDLVPRAVHGEGLRISTIVRDRVIRERASLLVRDVRQEEALKAQLSISEQQIHSLMAVPLQTESRVLGLVYVDSRLFVREFTPDDLNLLTVLANVGANRIEYEMFLEMQQREQIRSRDLEQAAEIQRNILPKGTPSIRGLDVAGHNAPCRTVGGDYYDFITFPDGDLLVTIGDVAGKGMSAALLMSNLQARFQLLAEEPGTLADLVSRLDRSLANNCPGNRFVSLVVCRVNPATGSLRYSNAGHNPPLLVRASSAVERLQATGIVLGVLPDLGHREARADLGPGDLLALYSDGITEALDPAGEEFGEQRLVEILLACRNSSADTIVCEIDRALHDWIASAAIADDMTVIVVRRAIP